MRTLTRLIADTLVVAALAGCGAGHEAGVAAPPTSRPSNGPPAAAANVDVPPPPPADPTVVRPKPDFSDIVLGVSGRLEDALEPEGLRILANLAWAEVLVLGDAARDAVASAPPATGPAATKPVESPRTVGGTPIVARSPRVAAAVTADLAALLRDERSYRSGTPNVFFAPALAVRFGHADGSHVDVAIDFDYGLLNGTASSTVSDGSAWGTSGTRSTSFAPVRPALVRLLKAAFPGRPEVESLTDVQRRVWNAMGDEVRAVLTAPDKVEALLVRSAGSSRHAAERPLKLATFPGVAAASRLGFDRTERWRADIDRIVAALPDGERVGSGYVVRGRGDRPDAAAIVAAVTDDDTYSATWGPFCFNPGIAYRFTKGKRSITVLVCLECVQIGKVVEGFENPEQVQKQLRFGVLSPAGLARQVELAKRTFPDDPLIQAFKPRVASD